MGNSISSKVAKMKAEQEKAAIQMKSDLATLSAILDAKESAFRQQLVTENSSNKELPVDTIVKLVSQKACDVSTAPSEKMEGMVNSLFGGQFLKALKGLIMGALDTVLGSASAGEKQTKGFTVVLLHGAVVRVDYFVYSYTFRSDGVATNLQNGLVFAVSMSTVKLASVNAEVIALLSGLTAEGSVGYMGVYNAKMKAIHVKATQKNGDNENLGSYSDEEARSLIISLFGESKVKDDKGTGDDDQAYYVRDRVTAIMKKSGADDATATYDLDAPDRAEKLNSLLGGLTLVSEIPKSELDEVFDEQKKILERMTQIYEKIAKMQKSTNAAIASVNPPN